MNCPIDGEVLLITERKGIEIDYCPTCRGVWLDRGELDKMIDAADRTSGSDRSDDSHRRETPRRDERSDDEKSYKQPKKKKPSSFLSELFELGG